MRHYKAEFGDRGVQIFILAGADTVKKQLPLKLSAGILYHTRDLHISPGYHIHARSNPNSPKSTHTQAAGGVCMVVCVNGTC